jgi:hypothetical protein
MRARRQQEQRRKMKIRSLVVSRNGSKSGQRLVWPFLLQVRMLFRSAHHRDVLLEQATKRICGETGRKRRFGGQIILWLSREEVWVVG